MQAYPHWPHVVSLLIGIWLFLSPRTLGFNGLNPVATSAWTLNPIATNVWIIGTMIMLLALLALVSHEKWEDWLGAGLGAWLFISPRVMRVSAYPEILWNKLVLGTLIVALAVWSVWLGRSTREIDRANVHQ